MQSDRPWRNHRRLANRAIGASGMSGDRRSSASKPADLHRSRHTLIPKSDTLKEVWL